MGLRTTQVDEKRLLSSHRSPWKRRPPLCHPEHLYLPAASRGRNERGESLGRLCWRGLRFEEVGRLRIGAK
jgi:hypothetical protein